MRYSFNSSEEKKAKSDQIQEMNKYFLRMMSILSFGLLLYTFGWKLEGQEAAYSHFLYSLSLIFLAAGYTVRMMVQDVRYNLLRYTVEVSIVLALLFAAALRFGFFDLDFERQLAGLNFKEFVVNLIVTITFLIELSKLSLAVNRLQLNPPQVFIFSFIILIIIGMGLLSLPNATNNGISFIDALFTSTSAVCVTGLIVLDTSSDFTFFGQVVIMSLFQIGGLGMMTFTSFFGFFFKGKYSLQNQLFLQDYINEDKIGAIYYTLIKIIVFTVLVEAVGVLLIFNLIDPSLFASTGDRLFFSLFHSISAFCNAGFSTLSDGLFEVGFRQQYNVHLVLAFIIILGGIGFPVVLGYYSYLRHVYIGSRKVLFGIEQYRHTPRVANINTKLIVRTTLILLSIGFISYLITERDATLTGLSTYGKIVTAFFGAVTPRTAGFNTVDMGALTFPTILIYLLLMWIGASPGSTGGGLKTSTFAVAILNTLSIAKGKDRVEIYNRVISNVTLRKAFSVILLSFMVIGVGVFMVTLMNPELNLIDVAFEVFSAFSTVGLSLGITSDLSTGSKLTVTVIMLLGRVGTLTVLVAFIRKARTLRYKYPEESVFIL
ncbi:TrkH family potassium uptake protein [Anditalea andensis]|uniref:ATPase n=1 Tax=Anditalea andensis TaxID=1048983 RepID=A0A074KVB8_9BACT|nr:potassium transporter TrkG [Anditalea andensis]KEO72165.1 ATPase [Anditalea andensis]